jgi:hypothetical protein
MKYEAVLRILFDVEDTDADLAESVIGEPETWGLTGDLEFFDLGDIEVLSVERWDKVVD